MKLTKQKLKEIIREELLKESSRMFDQESGEVMKIGSNIDRALASSTLKTLAKRHPEPKVKKMINKLIVHLYKSSKLLDDIYDETLGV